MVQVVLSRATISTVPTQVLVDWFNQHCTAFTVEVPSPCTAQQRASVEDRCLNLIDADGLLRYASGMRYSGGQEVATKVGEGLGEVIVKADGRKVRRFTKTRIITKWTGGKWVNRKVKPIVEWDNTAVNHILERRASSSDAGIHGIDLATLGSGVVHFPSIAACIRHMIASDPALAGMDWTIAGKIRAMLLAKKEQARIREALASTRSWLDRKPRTPRLFEAYSITLSGDGK